MENNRLHSLINQGWIFAFSALFLLAGCAHEELINNQAKVSLTFSIVKPIASNASLLKTYLYNSKGELYGTYPSDTTQTLVLSLPFDTYRAITCNSDGGNIAFNNESNPDNFSATLNSATRAESYYNAPGWLFGSNGYSFTVGKEGFEKKTTLFPLTKQLILKFEIDSSASYSIAATSGTLSNASTSVSLNTGTIMSGIGGALQFPLVGGKNYAETILFFGVADVTKSSILTLPLQYADNTVVYKEIDLKDALNEMSSSLTIKLTVTPDGTEVKFQAEIISWDSSSGGGAIHVF